MNGGPSGNIAEPMIDALLRHAIERHDQTAIIELADGDHETARLSYGELCERVRSFAASLQHRGWAGETIIVAARPGIDYTVAVLACMFAGAIAVPMPENPGGRSSARWLAVLRQVRPAAIITSTLVIEDAASDADRPCYLTAHGNGLPAELWQQPSSQPDPIAFLQFTSGSTGSPKGAVISQKALTATRDMIREGFEHTPGWRCVTWLPPWHDMGLVGGLLQPLGEGMLVVILPPLTVIQRPVRWLRAIERYRATVSGGPTFGYLACVERIATEDRSSLDLSSWEVAYCGAEPVRASALMAFADAFAGSGFARHAFYPCYGLAEATLFAAGRRRGNELKVISVDPSRLKIGSPIRFMDEGRQLVCCGRAWGEGRIAITDPETGVGLPERTVGEISISGPHLASGYWQEIEADSVFVGSGPDRLLRSGDLGFFDDAELYIVGRLRDMLIIRGAKYYSEDIEEQALAAHPALQSRRAVAFAIDDGESERPVVIVEAERVYTDEVEAIQTAVTGAVLRGCGIRLAEVLVVRPGSIPKTTSGKIERYRCRDLFEQGILPNACLRPTTMSSTHNQRSLT